MTTNKSLRTIKLILPVVALAFTLAFFSFRSSDAVDEDYYFFEFIPQPAILPSDGDYTTSANWEHLPSFDPDESESPCLTGSEFVCVLKAPKNAVDNESGSSLEKQLTNYISSQASPSSYVNTPSRSITQKDRIIE